MKKDRTLVNFLFLAGLAWSNFLARDYSFNQMETLLINLFVLTFYIFSRSIITSRERRLAGLNKDYERLSLVHETEHRDTEILHVLDKISAFFMTDKDLNTIFEHTLDGVQQILKADISLLELMTEKDSLPTTKVVRGDKKLELNENIYTKVIGHGNSILINNLGSYHTEYQKYKSLSAQGVKSFLIAPLKIERQSIGLLGIFAKDHYDFTGEELRWLTTFATHASLIIENARLLETTKRLSITDELTQLYNFRHFQDRLKEEFHRAKRYNHNLALLMCDIDYFKNYNDTNGHEAGNEVLRKLAQIMMSSVREVDFAARYGGEEFIILLIETNKDGALVLAEKLRQAVEKENFLYQEKQPNGNLTVTIGIAGFPEDATTSQELIVHADEALYRGKEEGRNRAVTY